jgi:hypothetical protein
MVAKRNLKILAKDIDKEAYKTGTNGEFVGGCGTKIGVPASGQKNPK